MLMCILASSLLTHEWHITELTDDNPLCSYLPPFITHPHRLAPSLCISTLFSCTTLYRHTTTTTDLLLRKCKQYLTNFVVVDADSA